MQTDLSQGTSSSPVPTFAIGRAYTVGNLNPVWAEFVVNGQVLTAAQLADPPDFYILTEPEDGMSFHIGADNFTRHVPVS